MSKNCGYTLLRILPYLETTAMKVPGSSA